eukprot:693972-Prymnesium_polylepis.1
MLERLCREGTRRRGAPVLELGGLLPIGDFLLDRPLSAAEFDSEAAHKASHKPRWHSLLQPAKLRKLRAACPGAANLVAFRHACVGYFIAE